VHPEIDNQTPFAFEPLFLTDEAGEPGLVPVLKGTYRIASKGGLSLDEVQVPVSLTGERNGPGDESSYKYEPETALRKPATDVALVGSAHKSSRSVRELDVTFRVGPLEKTVHVTGDRHWVRRLGGIGMSDAEPFEQLPLTYDRAFGGWDRSASDPARHAFEPRNPAGVGFRLLRSSFEEGLPLPNLEDPRRRLRAWGDTPPPAGFGFLSPHWQPRSAFAGTYDDAWMASRMPLLPDNFDRRFFNAGSPGLVSTGYLDGDEPVLVRGVDSRDIAFRLPRVPAPRYVVSRRRKRDQEHSGVLDTVIVDVDEMRLLLLWRGQPVPTSPSDVSAIRIGIEGVPIHVQ
jgi:hypothetical protein